MFLLCVRHTNCSCLLGPVILSNTLIPAFRLAEPGREEIVVIFSIGGAYFLLVETVKV